MINLERIRNLSRIHNLPIEDIMFIALNFYGINFSCNFNRMRMGLHVMDNQMFKLAKQMKSEDFYFALPINSKSPFSVVDNSLLALDGKIIGDVINPSEDYCDSNYPRRNGTVLNINPNARTSCRGCKFCYTGYQIPRDKKKIACEADVREFFEDWMDINKLTDLSHLIQVAVVTGCYNSSEKLCNFLLMLRKVLNDYQFSGEIFYLGSQIISKRILKELISIQPFCYCVSLECFERREDLLRDKKRNLTLSKAYQLMEYAKNCGHRVNFSYIVGLESLGTVEEYFSFILQFITSFPIVNIIQIHKYHNNELLDPGAHVIEYFIKARKIIEKIFMNSIMRPRVWENYRSLWFMQFGNEILNDIRTP